MFYAAATGLPLALSVLRASLRYTVLLGAMETVCGKVESASMLPVSIAGMNRYGGMI